jgi:hypothetical protein
MRRPTLKELPPAPAGKTGWPWTEEGPQLPDAMPDGQPWPRVSIVTPSDNEAQFIEEIIQSVPLQGCPDSEHVVIPPDRRNPETACLMGIDQPSSESLGGNHMGHLMPTTVALSQVFASCANC